LHQLIVDSGGKNVAELLKVTTQTIDAEWVTRKNPPIMIKFVNSSVLGANVTTTQAAASKRASILSRDDWNGISAVINNKVILLSSSLLDTEYGKVVAKLYIARAMHPDLFSDLDVDAVCKQVLGASGIYYYA